MNTDYKGIDYSGPGSHVNRDSSTGIRYGVIPGNAIMPEALSEVYDNGTDLDFEAYKLNVKDKLRSALEDFFHDYKRASGNSALDCAVENAFDAISDSLGDGYEGSQDCTRVEYERDGYKILTDGSGDVWILKSPYYTHAQFCSPCAPGACYLTSPCPSGELFATPPHNSKPSSLGLTPSVPTLAAITGNQLSLINS